MKQKLTCIMQFQKVLLIILSCFLLVISLVFSGCESETTDKNDPDNLQREEEQEQEIQQQRSDTSRKANPIYVAGLEGTNEAKGETNANGELILTVQHDSAFIEGAFSGLTSDFTSAYLHEVLQSERIRPLEFSLSDDKRSGSIDTAFELDQEEKNLIKGDSLYISIYTTKYDNAGEINGQFAARDTIPKIPEEN